MTTHALLGRVDDAKEAAPCARCGAPTRAMWLLGSWPTAPMGLRSGRDASAGVVRMCVDCKVTAKAPEERSNGEA